TATIDSPGSATTTVSLPAAGSYVFRLTATDGPGLTAADTIQIDLTYTGAPNQAPVVDAGSDQTLDSSTLPATATLTGSASDDVAVTALAWTQDSGPATATIDSPGSATTTVSLPAAGSYVFRLTATDGPGLTTADTIQIELTYAGPTTWTGAVSTGADDAEESGAGRVSLTGGDLELGVDGSSVQTVGLRFTGVMVPPGATITSADIQFRADEVKTDPTNLLIQAEAADSTLGFTTATNNISSRPRGQHSIEWMPPAWNTVNEAGQAQRTPDLRYLIQEVVLRGGWASGNSIVLIITGAGTRTADPFEGNFAPRLTIEYSTTGSPNLPPVADAGPDQTITLPATANLDGTASTDSGGAGIASYFWQQTSGPAGASVAEPDSALSAVALPQPGTYGFQLTVTDGDGLFDVDTVQVEALDATGPFTWTGAVSAGADDAEEDASSGKIALSNSDLDLVLDTSTDKVVGLRFTQVDIPANAVIQSAYIQFRSDEIQTGPTRLTIQGFATANLAGFTTAKYGISTRACTGEVIWEPVPGWTATGQAGPDQRTPDLAALVEEIIGLPGWAPGNGLGFVLTGNGKRTADSFEGGYGPRLTVVYTIPQP
ncbi:MAG TPA: PKD domain-containing protein, partial [Acidimicrobiia bacterium]|nr:PKD domain-containing protein [Acidimicrobiia bacterium]